jgi:hypothetical protein
LRALASELGVPLVTASQLNRSAVSADEHDHSHIAGGISKVNTADNLISIVTSKKKREAGLQELQFLKTRTSNSVGSKIELGYDWKSMRITNDVPQATPQLPNALAHNDDAGARDPRPDRSEKLAELVARARRGRS